jgi:hypothetical protein
MVLRPGDTLRGGQYEIQSVLGQGGFGITYKAWDRNLKRYVVLKAQLEHLRYKPGYENYVERFMKEGQIMAKLSSHPNLVRVFDLFSGSDNHPYLVMEFIEGQTLFELVKAKGKLPEAEVISIAKQIGSALKLMHDHQLVHRDVHPGNIMICADGKAVLIDLGGAKDFIASSQSSEGIKGHPDFAPYEQISNPKDTRHLSVDVFCLVGSLYFAVTGSKPTKSLSRKLHGGDLVPPRQLVSISGDFNEILMTGLELEASDRPQSIAEFLKALPVRDWLISQIAENPLQPQLSTQDYGTTSTSWRRLVGCVIAYTIIGIGVSVPTSQGPMWLGDRTGIVAALVVSRTLVEDRAESEPFLLGVVVVGAVVGAWAVAGAGAGAIALGGAGAGAVVLAKSKAMLKANPVAAMTMANQAVARVFIPGVVGVVGVLFKGSWEFLNGYGWVIAGSWWGAWPLGLGIVAGMAARDLGNQRGSEIVLLTLATGIGLLIGASLYHTVHPA